MILNTTESVFRLFDAFNRLRVGRPMGLEKDVVTTSGGACSDDHKTGQRIIRT
jgi:hypothetical protein